jgi:hypothetical protein
MKGIKKSIGTGISVLLLLCFSVAVLPMDFFHSHAEAKIVCKDSPSNKPCKHSVHVSSAKSFCWVCAIHVDSQYISVNVIDKIASLPAVSLFSENEITGYFIECLFTALRGPPQN